MLQYIADLKMYRFLQNNHVNRIVSQMWDSKTDIGGSMFDCATSYHLAVVNKVRYQEDSELRQRFYVPRPVHLKPMPHQFTLFVWKKSMSLRYAIEALIFFLILLVLQFEVSAFNKDLHLAMRELKEFDIMNDAITEHGGTKYDFNDPQRRDKTDLKRRIGDEKSDTLG